MARLASMSQCDLILAMSITEATLPQLRGLSVPGRVIGFLAAALLTAAIYFLIPPQMVTSTDIVGPPLLYNFTCFFGLYYFGVFFPLPGFWFMVSFGEGPPPPPAFLIPPLVLPLSPPLQKFFDRLFFESILDPVADRW